MFEYWSLRYKIYNYSLKLWLENIKQTSIAIVALFPMALPALVFMPFVFIGIILKPDTTPVSFFNTLWGYLLLLFCWVSYQRKGILGLDYSAYMASLPVSKLSRVLGDIGVTIYVANFFVLAPALLCIYALLNFSGDSTEALEVTISMGSLVLLSCYYCAAAVKFKTPWRSLFIFPLALVVINPELAKLEYTALWLLVILSDHLPRISLQSVSPRPKSMMYMFIKWESHYSENNKLVLVISLLLLSVSKVIIESVAADVAVYFVNFSAFLFGLVLAANLFSIQKLRAEYHDFLTCYPTTETTQQIAAIKYTLLKLLFAVFVLFSADIFSAYQWLLFGGFYIATLLGVIKWPHRFILPPVILGSILVLANILFN